MNDAAKINLRSPATASESHRIYGRIRDESPVCWNDSLNAWLITRHGDVRDALRDARLSVEKLSPFAERHSDTIDAQDLSAALSDWMVFTDPPRSQHLRRAMQGSFLAKDAGKLEHTVRAIVDELLDAKSRATQDAVEIDLVPYFTLPMPAMVILDLFGIARTEAEQIRHWSDELGRFVLGARERDDLHARAASAVRAMRARFQALIDDRRHAPRNDFTSQLIKDGAHLSDMELAHTLMLVLFAGHETTSNLIASALWRMARDNDLYQRLRHDRGALADAVEEFLRLDSPVELLLRIALEDVEVGGQCINTGDRVFLVLNSANRDPHAFDAPDEMHPGKVRSRHLAFGPGIHMCMGAPLARLIARVALDGVLERFSSIEPGTGAAADDDSVSWRDELMVHGPRSLMVRLLSGP